MILRALTEADKEEALASHEELALDNFHFLLGYFGTYDATEDWSGFLRHLDSSKNGENVSEGWVPATFLVAEVDGRIIGRVSIRHELNGFLENFGGHIGYGVRAQYRGQGYATQILRQALTIIRELGVQRVLITCSDSNVASSRVIEKCGGALENIVVNDEGERLRRYWIGQ